MKKQEKTAASEDKQAVNENSKKKNEKKDTKGRKSGRKKEEKSDDVKNKEEKEQVNMAREIIEMVIYLVFVLLLVWLVITFVGQRTVVDGVSMYDTLDDRDNLWVSKISYRLGDPERFDIVVFPVDEEEDIYYIKRIIGLPGEKVRIDEDGVIYINEKPLKESYGYETIEPDCRGRAKKGVTLGKDEYFVMGDNRNESEDSRYELVGNVKRDKLIGKAVFRIWPLSKFGKVE